MGFAVSDVVPFTQARANLSELADQAKAGAEKIITKNGESPGRPCRCAYSRIKLSGTFAPIGSKKAVSAGP